MYLLDTNVISELRRTKPHGAVVAWIKSIPENQLFISAVTIGELQAGIENIRNQNFEKAHDLEIWLNALAASDKILPLDAEILREWARLLHGRSDHLIEDAMIGATAKIHNLIVVTRNTRDFKALGIKSLNPFETS